MNASFLFGEIDDARQKIVLSIFGGRVSRQFATNQIRFFFAILRSNSMLRLKRDQSQSRNHNERYTHDENGLIIPLLHRYSLVSCFLTGCVLNTRVLSAGRSFGLIVSVKPNMIESSSIVAFVL